MDAEGTLGGRRLGTTVIFAQGTISCCHEEVFLIPHCNYVSVTPMLHNFVNTYRVPTVQQALGQQEGFANRNYILFLLAGGRMWYEDRYGVEESTLAQLEI